MRDEGRRWIGEGRVRMEEGALLADNLPADLSTEE
jgi:hypothetical protein